MASPRPVVLCLDDEPHNLDLLDRALRRRFDVLTESQADAALATATAYADLSVVMADNGCGLRTLDPTIEEAPVGAGCV